MTKPEIVHILSEDEITKAVQKINKMVGDRMVETAIKVGNFVLEVFFDNDIQEAMSKNPNKPYSYRKLQMHPELKIHYNALNQMVRVAAQEKILLDHLGEKDIKLLTYSHRVEILKTEDKLDIAKKCISKKYSIRDLRKAIKNPKENIQSDVLLPFNLIITKALQEYSNKDAADDSLQKLSANKLKKMRLHINAFLDQADHAKENLQEIIVKIDKAYEEKSKPQEKKKLGRPIKR